MMDNRSLTLDLWSRGGWNVCVSFFGLRKKVDNRSLTLVVFFFKKDKKKHSPTTSGLPVYLHKRVVGEISIHSFIFGVEKFNANSFFFSYPLIFLWKADNSNILYFSWVFFFFWIIFLWGPRVFSTWLLKIEEEIFLNLLYAQFTKLHVYYRNHLYYNLLCT